MRLLHVKKCLISLLLFAIFYTISDFFFLHIKQFFSQQKVALEENSSVLNSSATVHREKKADDGGRPKTVLLWTPWWDRKAGRNWFLNKTGRAVFSHCPVSNCHLTSDRTVLAEHRHDALLFHSHDLFQHKMRLPETRSLGQRYILFSIEPVLNCGGLTRWEYSVLSGYFNMTASYRRDADIVVPYGRIVPRDPRRQIAPTFGSGESLSHSMNMSLVEGKSRNMLFVTSHCFTDSDREGVARRLNKTLPIDFRGKCAGVWDERFRSRGQDRKRRGTQLNVHLYYFYLAAENSLCKDYITEKFFDAMSQSVVPVVYGKGDYSKVAPPHSYIDMADFESEEEAGKYLQYLIDNPAAYLEYFWWKPHFQVVDLSSVITSDKIPPSFPCSLCAALHQEGPAQQYSDLRGWWDLEAGCQRNRDNAKEKHCVREDTGPNRKTYRASRAEYTARLARSNATRLLQLQKWI